MPTPPIPDDVVKATLAAYIANGRNQSATALELKCSRQTVQNHLANAARRGFMTDDAVLPGYEITRISEGPRGKTVEQKPERGAGGDLPENFRIGKISLLTAGDGREVLRWTKFDPDANHREAAIRAAVEAFKEELPRLKPSIPPGAVNAELLNQFTVTDLHFGMLAHREETGADYDLKLAESLLLDWFSAAIAGAPAAHTAVLAQLGDLMHHDALESVTPAHKHVLDADSRLHKVIRAVIRTLRRVIDMLLEKHQHVHVVMASGNHDPASSVWIRELLATVYENEPRITVDTSPRLYYAYEWGKTGLYYHHMHKRGVKDLDRVFAGTFREMFGRCEYNYGHGGHFHSDAVVETALMHIERHETLAAPDAHASGGGWLSKRSAKVVTYSKRFGEVGRAIIRPEMVQGAA